MNLKALLSSCYLCENTVDGDDCLELYLQISVRQDLFLMSKKQKHQFWKKIYTDSGTKLKMPTHTPTPFLNIFTSQRRMSRGRMKKKYCIFLKMNFQCKDTDLLNFPMHFKGLLIQNRTLKKLGISNSSYIWSLLRGMDLRATAHGGQAILFGNSS